MNRRDFLKAVGLGALLPIIAPSCVSRDIPDDLPDFPEGGTEYSFDPKPDAIIMLPDGELWIRAFDGDSWGLYPLVPT